MDRMRRWQYHMLYQAIFTLRLEGGHIRCYKGSVCKAYLKSIGTMFRVQYSFKKYLNNV
jgi:hypothetical protein